MRGYTAKRDIEGVARSTSFFQSERAKPFFHQSISKAEPITQLEDEANDPSGEIMAGQGWLSGRNRTMVSDADNNDDGNHHSPSSIGVQRKCSECEKEEEEEVVQKMDNDRQVPGTAPGQLPATTPTQTGNAVSGGTHSNGIRFLVEDNAVPEAGQMRRTEFLNRLKREICTVVDNCLAGSSFSTDNCPYIKSVFDRHAESTPTQLEELIQRYVPAISRAGTADDVIMEMKAKAADAARQFLRSGGNVRSIDLLSHVPMRVLSDLINLGNSVSGLFFKAQPGGASPTGSPISIVNSLGKGSPIPSITRGRMEASFGNSFSDVEMHTGAQAATLNRNMHSKAFAVGNHIAFDPDYYKPDSLVGDALMAHELAHVNQQKNADLLANDSDSTLEKEADESSLSYIQHSLAGKRDGVTNKGKRSSRSRLRISRCNNNSTPTPAPTPPPTPAPPSIPPEFLVTGLPEDTREPHNQNKIYFDRNASTLDPSEDAKLTHLGSSSATTAVDLHAYKSEDETTANLEDLRKTTVDTQLAAKGHTAARHPHLHPGAGAGDIDYRHKRLVEIKPAGVTPATSQCSDPITHVRVSPYISCSPVSQFTTAQTRARQMLNRAITALSGSPSAGTRAALSRFFGATPASMASVITTVRTNLLRLRTHILVQMNPVSTLPATPADSPGPGHICANDCDSTCFGTIAYNNKEDADATMTLCPIFMRDPDVNSRGETLIHEGIHGITLSGATAPGGGPTAGEDVTYEWQRLINFIDTATALRNNDSYVLFIRQMMSPGSPVQAGQASGAQDNMVGFTAGSAEEMDTKVVIAWLQSWLEKVDQDVSTTYSTIVESTPGGSWSNSYYEGVMRLLAPHFGLTAPPSVPSAIQQFQVAGISDRYSKLRNAVNAQLTITRSTVGPTVWSAGPGTALTVGTDFFAAPSRRAKLDLLIQRLVEANPAIVPAHRTHYAALINEIRTYGGRASP